MIRYLVIDEVLELHGWNLEQSGGMAGVRDLGGLESALAQPQMAFAGQEIYPSLGEKAAALGFSHVCNHPFADGNKRIGHSALETFLILNGWELDAEIDDQERTILSLASGTLTREVFTAWVLAHMKPHAV